MAASASCSTGGPWRCRTTAARCSRRCGTGSACARPKDGCSPQGQCGCCTVLVDGQPRVACVTPWPAGGRRVTTLDRAGRAVRDRWAAAFIGAPGPASAGSARPGSSSAWPARRRPWAARRRPPSTRPCSPTCAAAPAGRRSARRRCGRSSGAAPAGPAVSAPAGRRRISRRRRGGRDSRVARRRPSDRSSPWGEAASPTTRARRRARRRARGRRRVGGRRDR